ncbi:MAG: lipopolysaccharide biosynthesis protein [Bacteroides oleiciplenus]|nr:lipopolysaccharide biosynthesis protein [Bacteroides oleiciplenus]
MSEISIKKAVLYNAVSKYGTMIVQLVLTMVLSRLIVPEAYGIIAIIIVLIGFLGLFSDLGLGINIIQHSEMSNDDVNSLFTFSAISGIALGFFMLLLSYPVSLFYNDSIYLRICPTISIVPFLNALNVVPNAILTRDKRFDLIAFRSILCSFFSGAVAIFLAFIGWGVYALISQVIIGALFQFMWNYFQCPLKLKKIKFKRVMSLLGSYSLYQIIFNFLNYFTRNLDNLIIGKKFGTADLAYYNKSYYLYVYPNNIFASVLTGVLHPFIRDYRSDIQKVYFEYVRIEKMLSIIGTFTMMTFFFCSDEIIIILFGDNWKPAGLCLKCLSICMWTQMMSAVSGSIFLGIERTDQIFKCGIINLVLIVLSILCGIYTESIYVLALCIGISYNIIFLITNYILVNKTMKKSLLLFLSNFLFDALFVFGFIIITLFIPVISNDIWTSLLIKLVIILVTYSAYILISGQYIVLLSLLNSIKHNGK